MTIIEAALCFVVFGSFFGMLVVGVLMFLRLVISALVYWLTGAFDE